MVGTAGTNLEPRQSLSILIPILSCKRLLLALDPVQVNNLKAANDIGQVDSVLTPSYTPINDA